MYDIEKIAEAATVDEAIALLSADLRAILISGGTDVLIKTREGKLAGCSLVSIHGLTELRGVKTLDDGTVSIGSACTFADLEHDEIINARTPQLAEAAGQVGGPQIRAVGTVGGNICNGATSADTASTLLSMDAVLVLKGPSGVRKVPVSEFYLGPGKTVRAHDEVLISINISPENHLGWGGHYIKYAQRNAMDIATLGVACRVRLSPDKGAVEECRLAFGVAAGTPVRAKNAEAFAAGKDVSGELLQGFSAAALSDVNPRTSWRASREFRLQLVGELSARALRQAIINAGGELDA